MTDKLLRIKDAAKKMGVSSSSFLRMVANKIIPAPVMLGNFKVWRESTLDEVIENLREGETS